MYGPLKDMEFVAVLDYIEDKIVKSGQSVWSRLIVRTIGHIIFEERRRKTLPEDNETFNRVKWIVDTCHSIEQNK